MKVTYPIKIYTTNFDCLYRYESKEEIKENFLHDLAIFAVERVIDIVITKDNKLVSLIDIHDDPNNYLGETKEEAFTEYLYLLINEINEVA